MIPLFFGFSFFLFSLSSNAAEIIANSPTIRYTNTKESNIENSLMIFKKRATMAIATKTDAKTYQANVFSRGLKVLLKASLIFFEL